MRLSMVQAVITRDWAPVDRRSKSSCGEITEARGGWHNQEGYTGVVKHHDFLRHDQIGRASSKPLRIAAGEGGQRHFLYAETTSSWLHLKLKGRWLVGAPAIRTEQPEHLRKHFCWKIVHGVPSYYYTANVHVPSLRCSLVNFMSTHMLCYQLGNKLTL